MNELRDQVEQNQEQMHKWKFKRNECSRENETEQIEMVCTLVESKNNNETIKEIGEIRVARKLGNGMVEDEMDGNC